MSTTMSWFKSRGGRPDSRSNSSPDHGANRDRRDTDPQTCLEVFRNHWQQALSVIINKKDGSSGSMDDVNTVLHNFEHMVTLLVGEEGIDGMPGPILHFLLEKDIFEKFCLWTISTKEGLGKLRYEQLRMFELAINQSKQLLLIHKPVIRPLMKLLTSCTDPSIKSDDIEYRTVLVLHQICVCISQQTVILESFFNTNADHGPARFLIFSLLIPFIHREGPIGQNARDALLLIMALSAKHPHIGQYTADSDFCPVLATGLSGLYSSLPRKITPPSDDWYMLTDEDVARTPDLQMFLNSLEFCNAVVQIGHPVVKNQLIKYIYDGFLVPVLGPALHQNSREEVMTATAYLDLFLRRITEPVLIRAFLKFILLEKNDEIIILDSLVTRINSNSRLSLVSLALFKTLINLNCEDVMLQLVFKYLIPCTHVMVSQRRSVKDLDMYSKSAEKFLTLRPSCCTPKSSDSSPGGTNIREKTPPNSSVKARVGRTRSLLTSPPNTITKSNKPFRDFFSRSNKTQRSNSQLVTTTPPDALRRNSQTSPSSPETKSEVYETSYFDYLHDARYRLTKCARACRNWTAPYNGETPPPDCFIQEKAEEGSPAGSADISTDSKDVKSPNVRLFSHGNVSSSSNPPVEVSNNSSKSSEPASEKLANHEAASETIANHETASEKLANNKAANEELSNQDEAECNKDSHDETLNPSLSKMLSSLDSVESFLHYLEEIDSPQDVSTVSIEDNLNSLEMVLSNLSQSLNTSSVDTSSVHDSSKSGSIHGSRSNVEVPCSLNLSSYVEITLSSPDRSNAQKVLQELPQRSLLTSPDSTLSPSRWTDIELSFSVAGSPSASSASRSFSARYSNSPPNIGPFLAAVFSKLDSMMQNSLYMNLLLTGIVARLAAYPQPLLRSFLLNHNLVFQPTVKSLVQVLSSVRQKVDNYARTLSNFEQLVLRARKNLMHREECFFSSGSSPVPASLAPSTQAKPVKAATIAEVPGKERRSPSQSLRDLLFRRSPAEKKGKLFGNKGTQLQRVPGGGGYLFINRDPDEQTGPEQSLKTWNAVYCAIVLEEFLKELAALAQEHAVLSADEGPIDPSARNSHMIKSTNQHDTRHSCARTFSREISSLDKQTYRRKRLRSVFILCSLVPAKVMVKLCSHGLCKSDDRYPERLEGGIMFIPFPKPKSNPEKCLRWIQLCGRPHSQLNPSRINSNRYVCSKHFVNNFPSEEFPDPLPADPSNRIPLTRKAPKKRTFTDTSMATSDLEQSDDIIPINHEGEEAAEDRTNSFGTQTTANWVEPMDLMGVAVENEMMKRELAKNTLEQVETSRLLEEKKAECEHLKKIKTVTFTEDSILEECSLIHYYTGYPKEMFLAMFKFLVPCYDSCPLSYIGKGHLSQIKNVSLKNQLFLTLCRLRNNFDLQDLALRFGLTQQVIGVIFNSWINYMFLRFGEVSIWPRREVLYENMPEDYKSEFPTTFVIVDCTEIKIQKPSSLKAQSQTYSDYKSSNTLKALVAVDPRGSVLFSSMLFAGAMSDKEIFKKSGFQSTLRNYVNKGYLKPGDGIMADKGFDIVKEVEETGLKLNIPPFAKSGVQMNQHDVFLTQKIAKHRVHVERSIRRIKSFKILSGRIPLSLMSSVDQIWFVCSFLTNFMPPCIKRKGIFRLDS